MIKVSDERFAELRETLTIKDVVLAQCSTDDLYREWEAGMYLDSAEGFDSPEQEERLIAVERELMSRPEAHQPKQKSDG